DAAERRALHLRLAELVPPREAARHLAAAGEAARAYRVAVDAAATASSGERAELLVLACDLPGTDAEPAVRVAAGRAALVAGRPGRSTRSSPRTATRRRTPACARPWRRCGPRTARRTGSTPWPAPPRRPAPTTRSPPGGAPGCWSRPSPRTAGSARPRRAPPP